jgi:hypothetical protein
MYSIREDGILFNDERVLSTTIRSPVQVRVLPISKVLFVATENTEYVLIHDRVLSSGLRTSPYNHCLWVEEFRPDTVIAMTTNFDLVRVNTVTRSLNGFVNRPRMDSSAFYNGRLVFSNDGRIYSTRIQGIDVNPWTLERGHGRVVGVLDSGYIVNDEDSYTVHLDSGDSIQIQSRAHVLCSSADKSRFALWGDGTIQCYSSAGVLLYDEVADVRLVHFDYNNLVVYGDSTMLELSEDFDRVATVELGRNVVAVVGTEVLNEGFFEDA